MIGLQSTRDGQINCWKSQVELKSWCKPQGISFVRENLRVHLFNQCFRNGEKTLKQSVNLPSGHFEVDHYTKISTTFSTNLMQNFIFNTKPTWNYPNQFNDSNGFRKVWNFLMDFQVAWWMHALIIQTHNNCE